jgi:UDP-glucose 4-epimerase
LAERLVADGCTVTVLDNLSSGKRENLPKEVQFTVGDVADASVVQPLVEWADAVFHLAAVASVEACTTDWLNAHRTNLTGTVTIFDAAARAGKVRGEQIPIIYASSAAVYGDNSNLPLGETEQPAPMSAYGVDKLSCERYAEIAWRFHQVPNVGLRFFNVYGPRQDASSPYSGVISKFMSNAVTGAPLTFFGDGEQTRDFIYVGDIVELLVKAWGAAKACEIFNGCTGNKTSLKQLASTIGDTVGKKLTASHAQARVGDIRHSLGSPLKASNILGFTAKTALADGLASLHASEVAHAA